MLKWLKKIIANKSKYIIKDWTPVYKNVIILKIGDGSGNYPQMGKETFIIHYSKLLDSYKLETIYKGELRSLSGLNKANQKLIEFQTIGHE
jgi:hypothetical protein